MSTTKMTYAQFLSNYQNDIDDIIEYIESMGYSVIDPDNGTINTSVLSLYTTWLTMSPEFFEKQLKRFFSEALNINVL